MNTRIDENDIRMARLLRSSSYAERFAKEHVGRRVVSAFYPLAARAPSVMIPFAAMDGRVFAGVHGTVVGHYGADLIVGFDGAGWDLRIRSRDAHVLVKAAVDGWYVMSDYVNVGFVPLPGLELECPRCSAPSVAIADTDRIVCSATLCDNFTGGPRG